MARTETDPRAEVRVEIVNVWDLDNLDGDLPSLGLRVMEAFNAWITLHNQEEEEWNDEDAEIIDLGIFVRIVLEDTIVVGYRPPTEEEVAHRIKTAKAAERTRATRQQRELARKHETYMKLKQELGLD